MARPRIPSPTNKTLPSATALLMVRHVQDVIAGAIVTDDHLDSLELWVGLEEQHGHADGGASQVIRRLIDLVRAERQDQTSAPLQDAMSPPLHDALDEAASDAVDRDEDFVPEGLSDDEQAPVTEANDMPMAAEPVW